VEVVASLSQGRTAAAQCGLFTHKSVPVIFEPPCIFIYICFDPFIFIIRLNYLRDNSVTFLESSYWRGGLRPRCWMKVNFRCSS